MKAEIITIGDEILIGQVIDTNSGFIAKELNKVGVAVQQMISVQDTQSHILNALEDAGKRSNLVILTGGLGPTKDDITKQTLCQFFEDRLVENKEVLIHVKAIFAKYNRPMLDVNLAQAKVPSKAIVLHNPNGTAPATWQEKKGVVYISLPGVPHEMQYLITEEVIPRVVKKFKRPHIIHRTLITYGEGESFLAHRIADWENALPDFISLAYLPNFSMVRLRLSGKGTDESALKEAIQAQIDNLYSLIGDVIYGEEEDTLEVLVAKKFKEKGLSLSTAESFTGGAIAKVITSMPGASAYFKGSIVAYATQIKEGVLGVPTSLIKEYSVVSEPVVIAMAEKARSLFGSDFSIATTGNAGPTKGDSDIEIGTVCIAVSSPKKTVSYTFSLGSNRNRTVNKSVNLVFERLLKEISKY